MLTTERPDSAPRKPARPAASTGAAPSSGDGAIKPPKMGRQPGLDGIRTFSVCMVAFHHAEIVNLWAEASGFDVGHHKEIVTGGFVFPEFFFVMSGYLISTIIFQEREANGTFSMRGFYARRARRLLPGLWVMMAVVISWATLWGHIQLAGRPVAERYHLSQLRLSALFTLFMGQNWYMIISGNGYFGSFPDLFRHIWTLSIDEQFYVLFPLLFVALYGKSKSFDLMRLVKVCIPLMLAGWALMAWIYESPGGTNFDKVNFAYLSTFTRIPGILVGVVLACVWQPWKWKNAKRGHLPWLDVIGLGSFVLLMYIGVTAHNEAWYVYRGMFPFVSLLAAAVTAMVVHPGAVWTRAFFGNKVIAGIGLRAFGIYLWHWPIFAGPLATAPWNVKMLVGIPLTALMAELSYRFVETPFRERAIGKWQDKVKQADPVERQSLVRPVAIASAGVLVLVGALALRVATAPNADVAAAGGGIDDLGEEVADPPDTDLGSGTIALAPVGDTPGIEGSTDTTLGEDSEVTDTTEPDTEPADSLATVDTSEPAVAVTNAPREGKIRLAIVGSSQARMLGNNLPRSAKETFDIAKGGKNGCTVFPDGRIEGHIIDEDGEETGKLMKWGFDKECKNWLKYFTEPIDEVDAEIVLVVTGGWEVYDLIYDDYTLEFASPEFDEYYLQNLQLGIDAAKERGAKVALLEVPCLRPMRDPGFPVPPVAERRDDDRTGHISDLFRQAAKADPENVFFIENADEWCTPEIGENKDYRPDGVHVSGKGAKLIMDTVTPQLLQIPL